MTVTIIFIIAICVFAAIGAFIGLFKKATETSFWGATVLIGVGAAMLVGKFVKSDLDLYPFLALGITIGAVGLAMLLFGLIQNFLEKRVANALEYSHYKNKDRVEENEAYIMNAIDSKDKKAYRRYRKKGRKIKDKAGGWGVVNRLLGFVLNGLNWLVAVGSIICVLLLFVELSGISFLQEIEVIQELLTSDGWVKIGSKVALDMTLLGTVVLVIKAGFNRGFFSIITLVVVLGMLAGFGFASWSIASSEACAGLVSNMQNGFLSAIKDLSEDAAAIVAKVIIAAVLFMLSLIIVVVTGILLPKLLQRYRDNDAFYVLDGIFGVIVCLAVLLAALLAVGGIAYTLNDLSFMEKFNEYEGASVFANCFYQFNPLGSVFENLPLRDWFEPKAA